VGLARVSTLAASFALGLLGCAHPLTSAQPASATEAAYDGPVVDVHAHLRLGEDDGAEPDQPIGTRELRALAEQAGVVHSALIVMARKGEPEATRARNDAVIAAARASGGFFYAVASVHPDDGDAALAELARLAGLGVRVIKLHPNTQKFDVADPGVARVVQAAGDLGLVLLFDGFSPWDAEQTGKFLLLAIQHPKARLILAHMGAVRFHEFALFGMVRRFAWYPRNVWCDLSAVAVFYADSPYREQLVWVIRKVGTDRILFGSDWPVDTPARAVAAVRALGLTRAEQAQILYTNAATLLGLASASGR